MVSFTGRANRLICKKDNPVRGSWATMHCLSRSIGSRYETLAEVNVRIHRPRETLAELQEATWGVELREVSGGRYAVRACATGSPWWRVWRAG